MGWAQPVIAVEATGAEFSGRGGDISTVAFRDGTLVVLVSATHADGGSADSDERDLRRHIVQFNGEDAAQKTAWRAGADGCRRWINDGSTFNCLKYDAGMQGPDDLPGGALTSTSTSSTSGPSAGPTPWATAVSWRSART
ncbi:hypothetical protein [Kineosporia mesophila]|uniref:hypothetical protein n=1 Tax=Kineosporia mesophila TaxID=566012 RepID=UPI001E2DBD56|nr:hypothetical protein [Kineosporia mesophila]MCD5352002.1 hypothetical protein [Kineosporia mesophila]